jgi:hypothetical protein
MDLDLDRLGRPGVAFVEVEVEVEVDVHVQDHVRGRTGWP